MKELKIEVSKYYTCQKCNKFFRHYNDLYVAPDISPFCSTICGENQIKILKEIWYNQDRFIGSSSKKLAQGLGQLGVQKTGVHLSYTRDEPLNPGPGSGLELEPVKHKKGSEKWDWKNTKN